MTKRILITGANRGVGLALVEALAADAEQVYAGCRAPTAAAELQAIAEACGNITVLPLDVDDADALAEAAASVDVPIDLLVCNAGVLNGYGGLDSEENALEAESMAAFAAVLQTNIAGPFFTVKAFWQHLQKSPKAAVAIVSSQMGSQQHEAANAYAYRASKAGVNNIMITLSHELDAAAIAVAAYHPGWVRTAMGGPGAHLSTEQSAQWLAQRFAELDMSRSGRFINFDGEDLAL
ncbi:MAG: SDR family NAD(P)-dependent oxidoreductase [Proteobacteria bacterium]|nr:SDR family NAD(P)-dependent oxidoreductase [Pseudomonadota bacterium]